MPEDLGKSVAVRNVEERQRADGHVKLYGIQIRPEDSSRDTAADQFAEHRNDGAVAQFDFGQMRDVLPVMNVFVHHQSHEVGVFVVVVERRTDELAQGFVGGQCIHVETGFERPDVLVATSEHGAVESFLAAEVVVDHPLDGVGARGDFIDACTAQALPGELLGGDREYVGSGTVGIPGEGGRRIDGRSTSYRRRGFRSACSFFCTHRVDRVPTSKYLV